MSLRGNVVGTEKNAADIARIHGKRLFLIPKDVIKDVARSRGPGRAAPVSKAALVQENKQHAGDAADGMLIARLE